jgi:hypothetical protein
MRDCEISSTSSVLVERSARTTKFRNPAFLQSRNSYCFFSIGLPSFCQSIKPPSNAAALVMFFVLRATTAPADVCSFGQEQYVTMSLFLGSLST